MNVLSKLVVAATAAVLFVQIPALDASAAGTRLLSYRQTLAKAPPGEPGKGVNVAGVDGHSINPAMSSDGMWVVFQSEATYFDKIEQDIMPDTQTENRDADIFLHHVPTGQTYRISIAKDGSEPDGPSFNPSISPNGRYITFESDATDLIDDDTNGKRDIFLFENNYLDSSLSGTIGRVSLNFIKNEIKGGDSIDASVADDSTVAFSSYADDVVSPMLDQNGERDVFFHSPTQGTKLVSSASYGKAANGISGKPAISGDGDAIAFHSTAANIVSFDNNDKADIFVRDLDSLTTELVSRNSMPSKSISANGHSLSPSISYDGGKVAFTSFATDLVPGISNSTRRIYLRNLQTSTAKTDLVGEGSEAQISSAAGQLNTGASYVVYKHLNSGSIFLYDSYSKQSILVSESSNGVQVKGESPDISKNGRFVTFSSNESQLKENYLGRGLFPWDELVGLQTDFVPINKLPCFTDDVPLTECSGIYLRDTFSSGDEPGPSGDGDISQKTDVKVDISTKSAGEASEYTITLERDYRSHEFKDVDMKLPVGMGASTKVPKCPSIELVYSGQCPLESKVGVAHADLTLLDNLQDIHPIAGQYYKNQKFGINGNVYFGEPNDGDVGLLYAEVYDSDLLPKPIVVPLRIRVNEDDYYRIKVSAKNIPNMVEDTFIKKYPPNPEGNEFVGTVYPNITRIKLTIDGTTAGTNGHPLLTNPTFAISDPPLDEKQAGFDSSLNNYGGSKISRFSPYQVEGAGDQSFDPKLDLKLTKTKPGNVVDLTASLTNTGSEADMRRAVVTLPDGFWVNPEASVGLCSEVEIDSWQGGVPCGDVAPIGTATIDTPIVDLPQGELYMVDTAEGKPLKMAVLFDGLIKLKLLAQVKLTSEGRIQVSFDDIPPYPVDTFKLTTEGLLKSAGIPCGGSSIADATFTAWEKSLDAKSSAVGADIKDACGNYQIGPFAPKVGISVENTQAGASPGNLDISIAKEAGDDPLTAFDLDLPAGFIGDLEATGKCTLEQVKTGSGLDSCKIGTAEATAQIFSGKEIKVSGALYNGQPTGDDFGSFIASFTMPDIAGGGKLTLNSSVRPEQNATYISTKVQGIKPVYSIKEVKMRIWGSTKNSSDGPLLMNPTFCSQGSFNLSAYSFQGSKFASADSYTATGCPLQFLPQLDTSISIKKAGSSPTVKTTISQEPSETAIRKLKVTFSGLNIDIDKLASCSQAEKLSSGCPAKSRLATLKAEAWPLSSPLVGDIYLGEGLQKAYIVLRGQVNLDLEGKVILDLDSGSQSLVIDDMPPISGTKLEATLAGGQFLIPNKCQRDVKISMEATSYSNQTISREGLLIDCLIEPASSLGFKVKLNPRFAARSVNAAFNISYKGPSSVKNLTVVLGMGKKLKRLKLHKAALRLLRRGAIVGRLTMISSGKKSIRSKIVVSKKGKLRIVANKKTKGKIKSELAKVKITLGRKLTLLGLPEKDVKGKPFRSYRITILGRRKGLLRNPPKSGKATFIAQAIPYSGKKLKAKEMVKIK